jgi:hypothetical protein
MDDFTRALPRRLRTTSIAAALFASLLGALSSGANAGGTQRDAKTPYKPDGDEGRIAGVVSVEGEVPRPREISMAADPVCAAQYRGRPKLYDFVVKDDRLAGAFVYVKSAALERMEFEPPREAAVLDRRRCRTVPHVLGLRAGQTLRVVNGDPTPHNYNFRATENASFNRSLAPSTEGSDVKFFEVMFDRPELAIPVNCNQHPWERGYLMVMPNPFFAVTDSNGHFTIEGLPPGDYEVVLWHERLKGRTAKVSVGRRELKDVNFALKFPEDDKESPPTPQP